MAELTPLSAPRDNRASPGELLKMLRHRSGLTQAQLAELLNLKSARMVRNWEGEFNLPTAERLHDLITIYLEQQVFAAGKEREEARHLWRTVKDWFETHNSNYETYPIFDEGWFATLPLKPQANAPVSLSLLPTPEPSVDQAKLTSHNLPPKLKPLLGRKRELARLVELLTQPSKQLITLTGAGGSGKTSLAMAVGQQALEDFPHGVYFIGLENVTSRETLLAEIARTLALQEAGTQGLLPRLKEYLKEKRQLLILDNFEQLVAEVDLLSDLLREAADIKLLVTSRIPLQLSFEREFAVGPLALPDKEVVAGFEPGKLVAEYPAVALFVERAQAVKPDFALKVENAPAVVEICRRLDGLPLALELAAARVRAFPPQKLLERLSLKVLMGGAKDLPSRQRTLHETISWSHDLLTQGEQQLFARLAVFTGGCTLEAAEAVCNAEWDLAIEVFEGLESLLIKNLLKQWEGPDRETRYGMLVTIREFGLDKLAERGEAEVLNRQYSAYYLAWISELDPKLENSEQLAAFTAIDSEYDNLRAILHQTLEGGNAEVALELSGALGNFWNRRGYYSEGRRLLEQALALPAATSSQLTALRAKALRVVGVLAAVRQGDTISGLRYLEESEALYRQLDHRPGLAHVLWVLAMPFIAAGDYTKAGSLLEEGVAISRELGDRYNLAGSLGQLGMAALAQNRLKESHHYFEESLVLHRELGNKWGIAFTLSYLGIEAFDQGEFAKARRYFEESRVLFTELGFRTQIVWTLSSLGAVALGQGEYVEARRILEEGLTLSRALEKENSTIEHVLFWLGWTAFMEGKNEEARQYLEEGVAIQRQGGWKIGLGIALTILGLVALAQGEFDKAGLYLNESLTFNLQGNSKSNLAQGLIGLASLVSQQWLKLAQPDALTTRRYLTKVACLSGASAALFTSAEWVLFPPFPATYEEGLKLARVNLDEATFEAAFAAGQAMSGDEMVAYALSE